MMLDLRELQQGSRQHIERRYAASALQAEPGDEYAVAGPVTLSLDVGKDRDKYRLVGRLQTSIELTCGRCLEHFAVSIDVDVDLRYLPHVENRGAGELEVGAEDLTTAYYKDVQIDLGQMVREQLWLALPMKPLCREACKGLCPVCGTNLNVTTCGCEPRWADPRLAPLKSLLDDADRK